MADIGKSIKKLRVQKNLKQGDLAEKLFVSRQTISNYENGKSRPDIDMIVKIAEILETDVNTLVSGGECQRLDRRKIISAVVKLSIVVVACVLLYLIYQRLWNINMFDEEFDMSIDICFIMKAIGTPLLSVLAGYYMMGLILVALQKEYVTWKYSELLHRIIGLIIGFCHVVMLFYCQQVVKSIMDYYRWKETVGQGYWSSDHNYPPIIDTLVPKFLEFQGRMPVLFVVTFITLGVVFRITKTNCSY